MGTVMDTHFSQFIPPAAIVKTAGTWTDSVSSNVPISVRTAAAATFNLIIPIPVPSNGSDLKGARLKSIDVLWLNGTADLTSVTTVELEKFTLPANATAPTGAAVTGTVDTNNDTTAKRITQASHTLTFTVTTPEWMPAGSAYALYITFSAAATSAITLYGARANFDLRM